MLQKIVTEYNKDELFDKTMVLLDEVVKIFDWHELTVFKNRFCCFQLTQCFWVGGVFIDGYHLGYDRLRRVGAVTILSPVSSAKIIQKLLLLGTVLSPGCQLHSFLPKMCVSLPKMYACRQTIQG